MKKSKRNDGLVFSTGPVKSEPEIKNQDENTSGRGEAVLRIERKGRGGKTVTVVEFRNVSGSDMLSLSKEIKTKCGVGGKLKGDLLDVQGDQRIRIKELLESQNLIVRGSIK